jgi:hypothetical protein
MELRIHSQDLRFLLRPLFQDGELWGEFRKEESIQVEFGVQTPRYRERELDVDGDPVAEIQT